MSPSIAEKARLEAEAAEAEENDEQHDDEQHDEPHDEPAEPGGEPVVEPPRDPAEGLDEPTEQMLEELRAANLDHHDHVRDIMGSFVDGFVPCETCNGIGIAYPTPAKPKLEPAPGLALCTVCKGPGELETPSTRSGYDVVQCTNCGGKGYVGNLAGVPHELQRQVETFPQPVDGQPQTVPPEPQPPTTDPRVQELRDAGYIVLERPSS